jgi:hypothetical protein
MKIKILAMIILLALSYYAQATVIETDTFVYSNKVVFSGGVDIVVNPISFSNNLQKVYLGVISTNLFFNNLSTNVFYIPTGTSQVQCLRGKIYNYNTTNLPYSQYTLYWYENADVLLTNCYWLANLNLFSTPTSNTMLTGSTTCNVVSASGFSTNDLIYFQSSNTFHRIIGITNTVLYFASGLINGHASGEGVSRVCEFGGFGMYNNAGVANQYGQLTTTNSVTLTNRIDVNYR